MARRIRKSRADIQRWTQLVSCLRLMNIAFTNVRIYPPNHPEVTSTLINLHKIVNPLVEELEDIGFGFMDELLYVEGAVSLEETAGNQMLVDRFTRCRVKYLTFAKGITKEDLIAFFQVLNAEAITPSKERPGELLEQKGVRTIHIVEAETAELGGKKFARKKTLLDWYEKAVATYRNTADQYRQGQPVDFKLLYRHIDDMTASIKSKGHEPYLLLPILGKGLDPHACHGVNVSILACALGQLYGLNTGQVNTLSICAFLHDLGRLIVPAAWTERKRPSTPDERGMAAQHTVWGSLFLLCKNELPPQMGVLADRHHSAFYAVPAAGGYVPDLFHKIISAADYYDLASIGDKYYWRKHRQDRVLHKMLNQRGRRFDPAILKLLVNCVGFYPAGSLVLLKDGRKGIVVRSNAAHAARPKVYLYEADTAAAAPAEAAADPLADTLPPPASAGIPGSAEQEEPPPPILDLAELNEAGTAFRNSILRVLPPSAADAQKILDRRKSFLLSHTLK
ncbi:MAG: hypothetical protein HY550_08560 [Elusimicrobia bacterium]|nr:hypothetical protein [Elusimicrobiota bacterium]